ncbi:MAG: hypothetical protein ACTSWL_05640 [Promethearchaeota archaeon]
MNRTTLEVLDRDDWNWVKDIRNKYEMSSVSKVIFKMIKNFRDLDIYKIIFLKNFEKFFEYHYYGIKELSESLNVDINITMKLISSYFGPNFKLFDSKNNLIIKNKEKIHKKMIEAGILPRELIIAYNLKHIIKKSNFKIDKFYSSGDESRIIGIENKEILEIIFPDKNERQMEIYNSLIYFVQNFFEKNKIEIIPCHNCENSNCPMKKPDYIYYKSGIIIDQEDIEGDLVFEIIKNETGLRKENILSCYGAFLAISIDFLIRDNLSAIEKFIKDEIYFNEYEEELTKILKILKEKSKETVINSISDNEEKVKFKKLYDETFKERKAGIKSY